ncbi:MAG: hypothetical protein E2O39_17575 [Planctomycetota bacterium]|nr:MAG: hypothetical protein E2O39_17575 [Planctomycetota bacterium]
MPAQSPFVTTKPTGTGLSNGAHAPQEEDLERALRSPLVRVGLLSVLVLTASWIVTEQRNEIFLTSRLEVGWWALFRHQVAIWSLWAFALAPLAAFARWLHRRRRSWILFLVVQMALACAVAAGATWVFDELADRMVFSQAVDRQTGAPFMFGERERLAPGERERVGLRTRERMGPGGRRPGPRRSEQRRPRPSFLVRARQNFAVYWVVLGLGAGVGAFLLARDRERVAGRLALRAAQLEADLARAQLGSLRDQLRPHFFFNALHTVGGLVHQGRSDDAMRVLSAIGSLLRTTLDLGEQPVVPLREELRLAESYLDIERVRLGERLKITFDVAPETLEAQVPVLLLQPLLENAIRHGISDRESGGSIVVTTREDGTSVVLEVRDDGAGFPDEILAASRAVVAEDGARRIGLENDRERLRVLFGEAQSFELSNAEGGGAVVRIRVPRAGASHGAGAGASDA